VIFTGVGVFLLVRILADITARPNLTYISQAVKDVRGSQDTLVDVFERVESFLRRLAIYTEVPPTTQMMNTIIRIMVEVLSIFGIATKEIKDGRMSK
jgi:hypothetical protein